VGVGQAQALPPGLIAFETERDGNAEIYTMNADGSSATKITNEPALDDEPAWSPDNTKLAFETDRDGNEEIYTMNADGSGQTRITYSPGADFSPAWSPDGRRIAFVSDRDDNEEIYTMNADGSGQTDITNNPGNDYDPDFSPDGRSIVFATSRDAGCVPDTRLCTSDRIYVMAADGSNPTRLTDNSSRPDFEPVFSPDGQTIAFARNYLRHIKIFTMNADGSNPTNIDYSGYRLRESFSPSFSPDGTRIAFASNRDADDLSASSFSSFEIYTMASDGSDAIRLTNNTAGDHHPAWQHAPNRLAYDNSARFCKAEQTFWGNQFASRYGGGRNVYGRCVSTSRLG